MQIAYQVRVSARAKYLQIRVSHEKGVEVVVPKSHRKPVIEDFVQANAAWIQSQLAKLPQRESPKRPESVELLALNQTWPIEYDERPGLTRLHVRAEKLVISGQVDSLSAIGHCLRRWLKRVAEMELQQRLDDLSIEHDCPYQQLQIRGQKTRWGSCSIDNHISLNYKLLFLPDNLCRHVILHELCHTREHNHSRRFWQQLAKMDEHSKAHKLALTSAQQYVPDWIYY